MRLAAYGLLLAGTGVLAMGVRHMSKGQTATSFAVEIQVDAAQAKGAMNPAWRFFGCDEPNYATMKDGRQLIADLGKLAPGTVYFRTHNLLTTGDGKPALKWGSTNAYTEDAEGRPKYDWRIGDRIFDTYLKRGVRPYVEIGFMPKAMSVKPDPYQHHWTPQAKYDEIYTGWSYPPKDYGKWAELVYQWVSHCVKRYGVDEVNKWYWEVWNEANIGYWHGTPEEFRKLHDFAIDAVRRALPTARVGGPDMAGSGGRFMRDFIEHCLHGPNHATGSPGTPIDFVSFHAKGAPEFKEGHVRMGIANQLRGIDTGFATVASYPELKATPIVIGESDPDGCAACQGAQLGYRNGTMYSSYTAACFAREFDLADRHGVNFEGALTWAFEFEDKAYFPGFRVLASNGINLPVFNVFRMLSKMAGSRVSVRTSGAVDLDSILKQGVRAAPDVSALAAVEPHRLSVLVWHYHDDDLAGPTADVDLTLNGLPKDIGSARIKRYTIDQEHSNAFAAWKRMGSPEKPTPSQYAQLKKASQLQTDDAPATVAVQSGSANLKFALSRQSVSLFVVEWE